MYLLIITKYRKALDIILYVLDTYNTMHTKKEIGMTFHNNLRSFRERAKLTQTELAEVLNVSQGVVWFWEIGRNLPEASKLPDLARALGCTIDELFRDEYREKMNFPAYSKAIRMSRGLTTEELAKLMDLPVDAVEGWENPEERSIPNEPNMFKLAEILGVTPDELFMGEGFTRSAYIRSLIERAWEEHDRQRKGARNE